MIKSFKEYLNESNGLHVFDIDETLFNTTAQIHVRDKSGNLVKKLTNQEFNDHKLEKDHRYDFREFRDGKKFRDESKPITPMIKKIKAIQRNISNGDHSSKVIMNTARADFDEKEHVLNKFKDHGVDIDKMHLHRAGNIEGDNVHPGEKKNIVLRKYLDTGKYNHVHFYDDSKTNLNHFKKLQSEYPDVKFHAYHVNHEGRTKKV